MATYGNSHPSAAVRLRSPLRQQAAQVLVVAPRLDVAQDLVGHLAAAGLQADRGTGADDVAFAVAELAPSQLVLLAVDDMLERARIRRILAAAPEWQAVPIIELGYGGIPADAVAAVIAAYGAPAAT